jgi:hypothetical protein
MAVAAHCLARAAMRGEPLVVNMVGIEVAADPFLELSVAFVRRIADDIDAGRVVQPRNVATQTEGSIIYALGQCCGRRSPAGTAASWNPTTPATKVTHVGRVQHRDRGGVDLRPAPAWAKPAFQRSNSTITTQARRCRHHPSR